METALTPLEDEYQRLAVGIDYHGNIDRLEEQFLAAPELLAEEELRHIFTDRMYIRQVLVPAGHIVTTRVHKTQHPFMVMRGRVSVFNELDGSILHIEAPYMGVTEPGTRRVGYTHEDTVWVSFHVNEDNETDMDILESRYIERHELRDGKTARELAAELKNLLETS